MRYTANISTNILRDGTKNIDYVVTPNSKDVFDRIFLARNGARRSFNLIGNYGTGKSTFLWALEKNLNKEKIFFSNLDSTKDLEGFEIVKIVGQNKSFSEALSDSLGVSSDRNIDILKSLDRLRTKARKANKGFVLIVDEFGKFLEHAAKNSSLDQLYLLQEISEIINDEDYDSYFIITLHQNFSSYGTNLSPQEKAEWDKVKGRFSDLLFNEPVEQLIFFASKKLEKFHTPSKLESQKAKLDTLVKHSGLVNKVVDQKLTKALFPLDWLSTHVLVHSLQKYGQNERSLFSFLEDDSKFAIKNSSQVFYSVHKVFDYLVHSMPSEINSSDNPNRPQWYSTFRTLERAELMFQEDDYILAEKVIKTIGLVNIFSKAGGKFDKDFLVKYFKLTGEGDVSIIIEKLLSNSIIRYYKHSKKINFLEGTDLDLEQELILASKQINPNFSVSAEVKSLVDYPIELVKRYTFETGIPRFFEYRIIDAHEAKDLGSPEGPIDGYINLIFEDLNVKKLAEISKEKPGNIFLVYKNTGQIKEELFKLKQFDLLIKNNQEDRNALKLLSEEKKFHQDNLTEIVVGQMFENDLNTWIHMGGEEFVTTKDRLYKWLAEICYNIYSKAPILKNELINKEFLSTPISAARKNLIRSLLDSSTKEMLGFDDSKFPPEKAIYISLLRQSGIHKKNKELGYFELSDPPKSSNLYGLWEKSIEFLNSSLSNKRNIKELVNILISPPFKLKKGLVDFWLPIFLIAKQEDFALFHINGGYTPFLDEDVLDLIHRKPENFLIKSYDVSGLKLNLLESYKEIVQNDSLNNKGTQSVFLSIFSNFLQFQRGLNNYSLKTNKLSNKAINLRQAIIEAKDPEDALFTLFPEALGYHSISIKEDPRVLESFSIQIREAIRELRNAYDELLSRIEATIKLSFNIKDNKEFNAYKAEILKKLKSINKNSLGEAQRVFYQRIISPLDDRSSWLKSVADAALGKNIQDLIDEEEPLLHSTLVDLSEGLFKANDIHEFNLNSENEKLLSFRFINESGKAIEEKIVINNGGNDSASVDKIKSEIDILMASLEANKRKEVLIALLSKNMEV